MSYWFKPSLDIEIASTIDAAGFGVGVLDRGDSNVRRRW